MSRRSLPQYCLHRPTGQAYVKIAGKQRYLGLYGSPESHRKYAEELSRWHEAADVAPPTLTIGQLCLLYLERCRTHYRKDGALTTEFSAVQRVLKRLNQSHRKELAAEFSAAKLIRLRSGFIADGLARVTVNREIGRIRRMFRWSVGDGKRLIPAAVLTELEAVADLKFGRSQARETAPVTPVPDADVDAVKPFVSRAVWGLIQFQRATGARPGEALLVRACDIDMSGDVWEYRPHRHKTQHHGKSRLVLIGPKGQAVLREYLTDDPNKYVFSPQDAVRDFVAKSYRPGAKSRKVGLHYTIHGYAAAIRRACIKAGVPHWHANQLRHSFATQARKLAGIEAVQTMLGHANLSTTEVYAERNIGAARSIAASIG